MRLLPIALLVLSCAGVACAADRCYEARTCKRLGDKADNWSKNKRRCEPFVTESMAAVSKCDPSETSESLPSYPAPHPNMWYAHEKKCGQWQTKNPTNGQWEWNYIWVDETNLLGEPTGGKVKQFFPCGYYLKDGKCDV